jgi:hypothetical protein
VGFLNQIGGYLLMGGFWVKKWGGGQGVLRRMSPWGGFKLEEGGPGG